jgi:hypothetical protein
MEFDDEPHKVLMLTTESISLRDSEFKRIEDWLQDREQRVAPLRSSLK